MNFLYPIVLTIHVLFSLALIISVLLQSSKGEGLAGAFGGGGLTGAVFGGRGAATFLSKATTILAIGFMITSSSLLILLGVGSGAGSVKSEVLEDLQRGGGELLPPPQTTVPGETPAGEEALPAEAFPAQPPADTAGK